MLSTFTASKPVERIHCDLWGPSPISSVQGFRYYVVFIDHYSRFTWFYPLKLKSDFFSTFVMFQKLVENQLEHKIKIFQCDGGGEFISVQFLKHLQDHDIQQNMSCPYTPQQNRMAERKHRHIVELGLSMIFQSKLPLKYWLESFFTANFVINLLPTSTLDNNESPFQKLYGKAPEYSALRVFGCACYPTLHDYAACILQQAESISVDMCCLMNTLIHLRQSTATFILGTRLLFLKLGTKVFVLLLHLRMIQQGHLRLLLLSTIQ